MCGKHRKYEIATEHVDHVAYGVEVKSSRNNNFVVVSGNVCRHSVCWTVIRKLIVISHQWANRGHEEVKTPAGRN